MNVFPTKLALLDAKIEIRTPKPLGPTAESYIHEVARTLPIYNQPIESDAVGSDSNGVEIKVNTVGRWLFGVPGFDGHLRIVPDGENVTLYYPQFAPHLAHVVVHMLKQHLEPGEEA